MYPISDLTAFCRKTTGDVPPKLVVRSFAYVHATLPVTFVSRARLPPSSVPKCISMYVAYLHNICAYTLTARIGRTLGL